MSVGRNVTRPSLTSERAAELARDLFGLDGEAVELPSERDRNYLVAGTHVLKVFHADTDANHLELQDACLAHLEAAAVAVRLPRVRATKEGSRYGEVRLEGMRHLVRMNEYLPGRTLAEQRPKTMAQLRRVGRAAGTLMVALDGFGHPAMPDGFSWDLRTTADRVAGVGSCVAAPARHRVESLAGAARAAVDGLAAELPEGAIHGDLNDHNVVIGDEIGVIDFGDLHRSFRIAEVAVAAAYAGFGFDDPLEAIATVAAGADEVTPLLDAELAAVVPLVVLRLALSLAVARAQTSADPANPYLAISQDDAAATLEALSAVPLRLAAARVRDACGRDPVPESAAVGRWLAAHRSELAPVLRLALTAGTTCVLDWSVTSSDAEHPQAAPPMREQIRRSEELMRRRGAQVGVGRYGEPRLVYTAPEFAVATNRGPAWRTMHLGVDLSCPAGTEVRALWHGTVVGSEVEACDGGYGPVVTVRHEPDDGPAFLSLYGHLDAASIAPVPVGTEVFAGQPIGAVGSPPDNGNWPPHLHFQLIVDSLDIEGPFPGVALPEQWGVWSRLCPSPAIALDLPEELVNAPHPDEATVVDARRRLLAPSLSTSYRQPVVAVRGFGTYLYDGWGRAYLDCVNNVAHVGHEHPAVTEALTRQIRLLNTNTRYPHPERLRFAERLLERFPSHLDTVFLVNSGSEANDLALRIATTVTGRRDLVVLEGAYHGHTAAMIEASPYKHGGPGGAGTPSHVHVVPLPDPYRRPEATGPEGVAAALAAAAQRGGVAAMFVESMPGVAGQIELPPGWLRHAFAATRSAGGLAIADEVQVGLGRVGTHWWAFALADAEPDIVTLGKPLGNGHPLAAVVTRRAIADDFANGMEYFNTFGGNPVSCAAGNAVLDVIEAEELRERAAVVGAELRRGLEELATRHDLVGDVRGAGMFLGVELVVDRTTKAPAAGQATYVADRARQLGVLLSVDGLRHNVLKFKPPLAFGAAETERVVALLDRLLGEDGAQPQPP